MPGALRQIGGGAVRSVVRVNGTEAKAVSWDADLRSLGAASQATVIVSRSANPWIADATGDPKSIPTPLTVDVGSPRDPGQAAFPRTADRDRGSAASGGDRKSVV